MARKRKLPSVGKSSKAFGKVPGKTPAQVRRSAKKNKRTRPFSKAAKVKGWW